MTRRPPAPLAPVGAPTAHHAAAGAMGVAPTGLAPSARVGAPVPAGPPSPPAAPGGSAPDLATAAASLASVAAALTTQAQRVAELLAAGIGTSPNRLALLAPPEAVMATTMQATDAKLTLTQAETAELLGVHPRTLQRLRAAGEGPRPITIGKAVRYRRADLLRWLEGKRS